MIGSIIAADRKTQAIIEIACGTKDRKYAERWFGGDSLSQFNVADLIFHNAESMFVQPKHHLSAQMFGLGTVNIKPVTALYTLVFNQPVFIKPRNLTADLSMWASQMAPRGDGATYDRCLQLCSRLKDWAKVITRPWPFQRRFSLSWIPPNPTNSQTPHTHTAVQCAAVQYIHNCTPLSSGESELWVSDWKCGN